ncbi:MAG: substrate-binding domain-containing protein [Longimicrobiales bacterium]
MMRALTLALAIGAAVVFTSCSRENASSSPRLLLATTHTVEDSGLLDTLVTQFRADHPGVDLQVVVAGSGEVLTIARRGDVDVLLTHSPDDERAFVTDGFGVARRPVMHNSFVLAGPSTDSAKAAAASTAVDAFTRIHASGQLFISRGDDSGTHRKEQSVWKAAGITPDAAHYLEAGAGMADALRVASQKHAYILTDLATLLTLQDKTELELLYQGDPVLRNDYSVIVVRNARNGIAAELFASWITSASVQKRIAEFGRSTVGRSLFIGDAVR